VRKTILNDKKIRLREFLVFFLLVIVLISIPVYGQSLISEEINSEERICLAKNVYYEARDQGLAAQIAVSLVVLNRVKNSRYPNNICDVIYQGPTYSWKPTFPVRHRCQFSWYCDGKSDQPKEVGAWHQALEVVDSLLTTNPPFIDIIEGATHYHSKDIVPHWAAHLTRIIKIEDHIFYRLKP